MADDSEGNFTLAGADEAFGSRTKDVFASLETIAMKHTAFESTDTARRESEALLKPDPTDDPSFYDVATHSGDSFIVPALPPPKRARLTGPDYQANPSRWKMYDLSNVSATQMSEHSNAQAAQEFLSTRHVTDSSADTPLAAEKPEDNCELGFSAVSARRHVFRKPDLKPKSSEQKSEVLASEAKRLEFAQYEEDLEGTSEGTLSAQSHPSSDKPLGRFMRHAAGSKRDRQVRHHASNSDSSSDEDDDESANTRVACDVESGHLANEMEMIEDDTTDSDDFSELAQLGSDSDEDDETYGDERGISEVKVAVGTTAVDMKESAEKDSDLDGVD